MTFYELKNSMDEKIRITMKVRKKYIFQFPKFPQEACSFGYHLALLLS